MGPRGFWIALAIILFYLIARPHVGTVWRVTVPTPGPLPSGLPPGAVAETPPPRAFLHQDDCLFAVTRFRALGGECVPENALLWGW